MDRKVSLNEYQGESEFLYLSLYPAKSSRLSKVGSPLPSLLIREHIQETSLL